MIESSHCAERLLFIILHEETFYHWSWLRWSLVTTTGYILISDNLFHGLNLFSEVAYDNIHYVCV